MKKRGQFYLLSAIIIISIIIGFSTISTYTKKTEQVRIFDLGEELEIESANVLDYGTYPALANKEYIESVGGLDKFLEDFVEDYDSYIGEGKEISFVFGNPKEETATMINYNEEVRGSVSDVSSITITLRTPEEGEGEISGIGGKKRAKIKFNNKDYDIELKPGENFFFVISQDIGEEKYIVTSEGLEGTIIEPEDDEDEVQATTTTTPTTTEPTTTEPTTTEPTTTPPTTTTPTTTTTEPSLMQQIVNFFKKLFG